LQLLLIKLKNSRLNAVYTVGSGYFGDVFKKYLVSNKITQNFSSSIKCWSNIQSINARTICDINLSFVMCINFEEIIDSLLSKTCPIIDNNRFYECFKDSYYQAIGVKSAIICKYLKCRKLLILRDVNGIYTHDPKKSLTASKIQKINAKDLISKGRKSVDLGLAEKVMG
jgi:aspartokinase-like uncharacterized kinase